MIDIDTERLLAMVSMLEQANNEISIAAEKLQSITTHNSWSCRERYAINEAVLENKRKAKLIQSQCSSFCAAVKEAAAGMIEEEKNIATLSNKVEQEISAALALPVVSKSMTFPDAKRAVSTVIPATSTAWFYGQATSVLTPTIPIREGVKTDLISPEDVKVLQRVNLNTLSF